MRNDSSDFIGDAIQAAFIKSKLTVIEFIKTLYLHKDNVFDITETTFHAVKDGHIITCYFVGNRWYAKY